MSLRLLLPLFIAASPGAIRFEDVTAAAGIDFTHSFGSERLGSILETTGAGCTWFDFDNDGHLDLYVVSGKPLGKEIHPYPLRQPPQPPPGSRLYRNNGNGAFTDVTARAGLSADLYGMGAIAADYDNDGHSDLFLTGYGRAILYRNRGNGAFEDATAAAGIHVPGWSIGASWLDYDRDGCVDLFVGRYLKFDPAYRAYYAADNFPGPLDYAAETNLLLRNNCRGGFTDVSQKAGVASYKGRAMGVAAADFDGDLYPDIYVANDKTANFLFHNQRDGTFKEIAAPAGVAFGQRGENTSAMGPVFLDFDGDGRIDLWVSDSKYNRMLRSAGANRFEDITERAGISQLSAQYVSWGTGAHDFDNDGYNDVFVVHGGLAHLVPQEHSVFRNTGNWQFEDVSGAAGPFFETKSVGRGSAFADYDNDGRIDAFIVNLGARGHLIRNRSTAPNHWIAVRLIGKKSNRDGIGARVIVTADGRRQVKERVAGSGYLSQDDPRLYFGLGRAATIDSIIIDWPSGAVQSLKNPAPNRLHQIEEP